MPDDAREVIFPEGIPIQWMKPDSDLQTLQVPPRIVSPQVAQEPDLDTTDTEGGLRSETQEIQEQVRLARMPDEGENLLMQSDPE